MPGITVCEVLGEGTYGRVYRARTETGDSVCVKEFKASEADGGMVSVSTIRELQALRELRHPNVVELRDVVFLKPSSVGLVFEHAEADLGQVIYAAPAHNRGLTRRQSLSLLYQLLAALSFCHARGFMHRDIKPQNLLVRADGVLKVADWGLARCTDRGGRAHTAEVVTVWYRAPELLLGSRHYTPAVDLWSAGCVFFEMREGRPMYRGSSDWDQLVRVFRRSGSPDEESWPGVSSLPEWHSSLPRFPRRRPSSAALRIDALEADLLDRLLALHPESRLTAGEALAHPLFDELFPSPLSHHLAHDAVVAAASLARHAGEEAGGAATSSGGVEGADPPAAAASGERPGASPARGGCGVLDSSLVARALDFGAAAGPSQTIVSPHGVSSAASAAEGRHSELKGTAGGRRPRRKRGRPQSARRSDEK
ncbi:hypothetical protein FNF29_00530 [Cafeteria roenbergensis]|uniref:Cyclin-dependent kinase 2 homolog n=1 Tax=Cafeteria roenbergensis TaxID=33653 RepID=A0A5A8CWP3_CAFRO|nr:hypothetical protein FNF29_00530 [Cafeteria roenbergensis]|eukprot:KAA0157178.1 hypothetical protein FNF29_00530 [Cafeteria roenbergensis]